MDLYLEFRKMVSPLVIEDMNEETGIAEDSLSLSMLDEKEEGEVEEDRSSFAFPGWGLRAARKLCQS